MQKKKLLNVMAVSPFYIELIDLWDKHDENM